MHLCQECAEKQQLLKHQELNLSAILQTVIGQHVGPLTDELARLTCPACGIKYMEFKAEGRLGCPHDYEVFQRRPGAAPAAHPSRPTGTSARCRRHGRDACGPAGRAAWNCDSNCGSAVEAEAYEEAARLRDLIRQKEATDEPG